MNIKELEDLPRRIRRNLDCPMTKMGDRELELMVEPLIDYLDNRDTGPNPPLLAVDFYERWVKGDRNSVMSEIGDMSAMRAGCTVAFMMVLFHERNDDNLEAEHFIGTMQERLK